MDKCAVSCWPLKAFFSSSEIASDYSELKLMNDSIQKKLAGLLAPHMKPDWRLRHFTNAPLMQRSAADSPGDNALGDMA